MPRSARAWRTRCASTMRGRPCPCPCGSARTAARARSSSRPTPASPERVVATRRQGDRGRRRRGAADRAARLAGVGRDAGRRARGHARCAPRSGCASAGWRRPRWPSASARSRGRRPTRTSARRSTSSSTTPAAPSTSPQGAPLLQVPGEKQLALLRPARGRGGHLAVELPGRDPARHGRRRAGHGQRRRAQAGRAGARAARCCSSARCARRACRPTRSRCSRARATSAPRWCATRACTRSPSPARGPSAWRSSARPAQVRDGQKHLKRVIAEMGGKNCVIVDSDADLDEVVPALVTSAYLYAGQKCSAAARVLVPRGDPRRAAGAPRRRGRGARRRPGGAARRSTCRP